MWALWQKCVRGSSVYLNLWIIRYATHRLFPVLFQFCLLWQVLKIWQRFDSTRHTISVRSETWQWLIQDFSDGEGTGAPGLVSPPPRNRSVPTSIESVHAELINYIHRISKLYPLYDNYFVLFNFRSHTTGIFVRHFGKKENYFYNVLSDCSLLFPVVLLFGQVQYIFLCMKYNVTH